MPPQVLHVAGQVGEQHLNLVAPLGLQEEALVVAAGEKEQSLSRLGWSSSDPVSFLPLLLHEHGCVWPPSLASSHLHPPRSSLPMAIPPAWNRAPTPPRPALAASSRQKEAGFALGGADKLKVGATGAQGSLIVFFSQT